MAGIVVVFDFDKTIIDCDSDNWVVDHLGATHRFEELLLTMPWNKAIDTMMSELHSEGRSISEIAESLRSAPIYPQTISAIKSAYALGCELRIVSDANLFFIMTILEHHGLVGYFSEINTNPGFVDEEGRLRIKPFHDFNEGSHGCTSGLCPPNMCKGLIIERIKACALAEGKKKFIYLGDGKGDYCPSLKMREEDYVMPRKGYPVWELICSNRQAIKAEIHEWSNAEELESVLLGLIAKSGSIDRISTSQLLTPDCKFQSIPSSALEVLPQALGVRH